MSGWISIHRKILDNPIVCKDPEHIAVWIYLLLNATHTKHDGIFKGERITLEPGQLITGRKSIASKLKISESKVQRILKTFENEQQIEQQTSNQNRLITIVNWNLYQNNEQQNEQLLNIDRTTTEQQLNTNNKDNKDNNDNNIIFNYSEKLKNVISLLQSNIGIIPPIQIELISEYVDIFDLDMFEEAVKIACNKKVRTVHYTLGILRQWQDNNIITISDLEALREEKKVKSNQPNSSTLVKKTKFHNFEQRSGNYSADELEDIARRKRAAYKERMNQDNGEEKGGNESLLDI